MHTIVLGYIKNDIGISPAFPPFMHIDTRTHDTLSARPSWLSWQSVALDTRAVSSIFTEGLGVAFFATGLG